LKRKSTSVCSKMSRCKLSYAKSPLAGGREILRNAGQMGIFQQTVKVKDIVPPKALVLAPMAGITDPPYRLLAREKGADLAYTEMMSAKGLLMKGNKGSDRLLEVYPHEGPLMGQLYGSDPGLLAEAASLVQEMGLDGVDINAGCPVRKVVKKGGGAALLREPTKLRAILTRVRDALHIPFGIKIRSGWDEGSVNALQIVQMAEDCGVDLVAIHPRPRSQKFGGEADWGLIRMAKERTRLTVIGNGDVRSPEDAVRMLHETGCDGVMIGRGSCGNPWIFEQARGLIHEGHAAPPPSWDERKQCINRHLDMLLQRNGTPLGIVLFIKHLGWYVKGLPSAAEFRGRINTIRTKEGLLREMEVFFQYIEGVQGRN
jgi:tRNA-dihydrouridine synthase B